MLYIIGASWDGGGVPAFYHVCFAVPDLELAMRDLGNAAGCAWNAPWEENLGEWEYRMTFSCGEPPFIELVTGSPGSPWDATDGARFDHLGYWTSSVAAGSRRLARHGFPEVFSGCPSGRPYVGHRVDSIGASVELFDASAQPFFLTAIAPGAGPMPAILESDADQA